MKIILLCLIFWSPFSLADTLLAQGSALYAQRADLSKAYKALELFEQHLTAKPNSVEALWRASTANYYIGHIVKKRKERKKYFQTGIDQAQKCVEITNGKQVECYFWLATNLALLKQEKGLLSMAFGLNKVFKNFEKALKLDPNYASAGPYRMLALLSQKAPGFLGGNKEKAIEYIKKSIELSPNEPLNFCFYAKFLIDADKEDEALKLLESFIITAKPETFAFYESHTTFKNIQHYVKTKKWLE